MSHSLRSRPSLTRESPQRTSQDTFGTQDRDQQLKLLYGPGSEIIEKIKRRNQECLAPTLATDKASLAKLQEGNMSQDHEIKQCLEPMKAKSEKHPGEENKKDSPRQERPITREKTLAQENFPEREKLQLQGDTPEEERSWKRKTLSNRNMTKRTTGPFS